MDIQQRKRLATLMARLAESDMTACVDLYFAFGDRIRASLVAIAKQRGLRLPPSDADALAIDVCTSVLPDLARSWQPEGALPWSWGRGRLARLVDLHAGVRAGRLPPEDEWLTPEVDAWCGADPDPETTLTQLAERDPTVALLCAACVEALTPGERATLLRYELQRGAGDPSPANTVAAELALKPAAVRQRVSRAKRKLTRLAQAEPRYQPLVDLALLGRRAA